jgi:hypothetical protein
MGANPEWMPRNLTERKFREYWERTEGPNERQRFGAIQRLMQDDLRLRTEQPRLPQIIGAAIEKFADGRWHAIETIAKELEVTPEQAETALRRTTKLAMEKKQVGKSFHFRLFGKTRMISSQELTTKLGPIIEGLRAEGKKRAEAASPATVAHLTAQLQKLIEEWSR